MTGCNTALFSGSSGRRAMQEFDAEIIFFPSVRHTNNLLPVVSQRYGLPFKTYCATTVKNKTNTHSSYRAPQGRATLPSAYRKAVRGTQQGSLHQLRCWKFSSCLEYGNVYTSKQLSLQLQVKDKHDEVVLSPSAHLKSYCI